MAPSPLYSSLSGNYNAASDMANVALQRSQITSGSYGRLFKAYVKKVGNKAAMNTYRATGSTVASVSNSIDTGTTTGLQRAVQYAEQQTGRIHLNS